MCSLPRTERTVWGAIFYQRLIVLQTEHINYRPVTGGRCIDAKAKPELLEAKAKATIWGPQAVLELEDPIPVLFLPNLPNLPKATIPTHWWLSGHRGDETLRPQDTSAPVPKCPGHFGTGAEVSWGRSVSSP